MPLIAKVIEKGADTNCTEQSAFTPLHLAARANRFGKGESRTTERRENDKNTEEGRGCED